LPRGIQVAGVELDVKVGGLLNGFDVSSSNPACWSWPGAVDLDANNTRAMPPCGVYALAASQQALKGGAIVSRRIARWGDRIVLRIGRLAAHVAATSEQTGI
jgi:hypothetical protein